MKILLVAPGPRHSTFDVYRYYLDAMRQSSDIEVLPFNLHNIIDWHYQALKFHLSAAHSADAAAIALSRGTRELLVDVVLHRPDVVHIIAGGMLPSFVWESLNDVRQRLKRPFIISTYLTESPYQDIVQLKFVEFCDVVFLNDKYSLKVFDPDNTKHVYYLPHSYNPAVHRNDYELDESYKSDVFFTATPFRERGSFLSKVDWSNINFKLGGFWKDFMPPEEYLKLKKYNFAESLIDNDVMARYYNGAKIALNIHRTRMDVDGFGPEINNYQDAYSIGPRIYEAVMCGALVATDFRQEAVDLFGNSLLYFDTPHDLQNLINKYIKDDSAREEKIFEAQEKIRHCTFVNRLNNIVLPVLYDVKQQYLKGV